MKRGSLIVVALALLTAACSSGEGAPATTAAPTTTAGAAPESDVSAGRLLFSRFIESTHTFAGMFASDPDGTNETEVPLPGPEGGGRWSHSGAEIAVMTLLGDGRVGTAIISEDGTVLRVLEAPDIPTLNVLCTVWSPDDTRLACEGWDDTDATRRGIYTVRSSDGGDLQRLTTPPEGMGDLPGDFSPDGGLLVFKRAVDEVGLLMLVAVDGGEPYALTQDPMEDAGRFSQDGGSVLTSGNGRLVVVDLEGSVVSEISQDGAYLFGPVWSPDGTRIAFSMGTSGPFAELYTSLPDGTDRRQVTFTADNEIGVDWRADLP